MPLSQVRLQIFRQDDKACPFFHAHLHTPEDPSAP